jgi:hypothetical protein
MSEPRAAARDLAKGFGPVHNVAYYSPEVKAFTDAGMRGWWQGYFAYRSAALGQVPASVVTAIFYNFAPRMVERAIPSAWEIMSPPVALALRTDVVDRALRRVLGDVASAPATRDLADLARRCVDGAEGGCRPLYAAHASLPWPDEPHLALWHACTLLREHRGDSHVVALAAADVGPVACHVLMAQTGHGNRESILPIRGWTEEEWAAAEVGLAERGWLDASGSLTAAGRDARRAIEAHTDRLTVDPVARLGPDGSERLLNGLAGIVARLAEGGIAPMGWPPPHLLRPTG